MKKVLLFAALAMTAMMADAKPLSVEKIKRPALSASIAEQQPKKAIVFGKKSVTKRSKATGLFYKRPAGTMYTCFDEAGNGYGRIFLVTNPFMTPQFVPVVAGETPFTWHLNLLGSDGIAMKSYDISEMADPETGVLYFPVEIGSMYPLPTIVSATDSFTIGHTPWDEKYYTGNYYWSLDMKNNSSYIRTDSIAPHAFIDDHAGTPYYWGALTPKITVKYDGEPRYYILGTGTYQMDEDDTLDSLAVSVGVQQYFEKPQSPLYVEDVFVNGITFADQPIVGDAKLTMTINNAVYDEEAQMYVPGDKTIATLECTAEDVSNVTKPTKLGDGHYIDFVLTFKQRKESAFGINEEPFTINEPFIVTVTGFEQEGVDIDLRGHENPAEDLPEDAYVILDVNGKVSSYPFYRELCAPFVFNSCFDYVEPFVTAETSSDKFEDFNVLLVSEDAETITNKGFDQVDFTMAYTAFPWYNSDNEENYILLDAEENDAPEWIKAVGAESEFDDDGYFTGTNYLSVECEPLPAGEKGRYAVLYVYGRGYISKAPVIIVQGEVEGIDEIVKTLGIENANVKPISSEKFFNLKGQQVKKANKGLFINSGKKFFVK